MRRIVLLPALLILIALAGCGSSKSSSTTSSKPSKTKSSSQTTSSPQTTSSSAGTGKSLTLSEKEYSITPSHPTVSSGMVRITVRNVGHTVHALEVEGAGPGGKDVRSSNIQPGSTTTMMVSLKRGKSYEFYCPVDGHKSLGMKGEMKVRSSASASSGSSGGSSG